MEQEFETLLSHLGQDVGYIGLRIQKDAQKCIKNLKTTHDYKTYCGKLADILKKVSEYTIQYSKDLQGRIRDYNKEEEYSDITKKLKEISCQEKVTCTTCRNREEGIETSNSLGPPNNNIDEKPTEPTKYDLKNEVLSQYSLHIASGEEDEIKSERLTQVQTPIIQSKDVSTNDVTSCDERLSTQQQPSNSSYDTKSPSLVDNPIIDKHNIISEEAVENCCTGSFDNDTDMANSFEISHSEEIQLLEDHEDVECTSNISQSKNDTIVSEENPVLNLEVSIPESRGSNELQKHSVIALPYKPIFDKDKTVEKSASLDTDSIKEYASKSDDGQNPSLDLDNLAEPHNSDEQQKIDAIPLPYKPIVDSGKIVLNCSTLNTESISVSDDEENPHPLEFDDLQRPNVIPLPYKPIVEENKIVQEVADAKAVAECIYVSDDGIESSNYKENSLKTEITASTQENVKLPSKSSEEDPVDNKKLAHIDQDNDCDAEIVSVASSHEDGYEQDDDSDVEIIENISAIETNMPQINSIEEVVDKAITMAESHNTDEKVHSGVEAIKNNASPDIVEEVDEWDAETVANTPPLDVNAVSERSRDSDQETIEDSSQKQNNEPDTNFIPPQVEDPGLPICDNRENSPLPLDLDEDRMAPELNYSEETVANCSPLAEGASNDSSDHTIITSPIDQALLNSEEQCENNATAKNTNSIETDSTSKVTLDEGEDSDNDDNVSKITQNTSNDAQKSNAVDCNTDSDDDLDTPIQRAPRSTIESGNISKSNSSDPAIVDAKAQDDKTIDNNVDLVDLARSEAMEELQQEVEEQDVATQDIEIPQNLSVPEGDDVVMENCDNDTHSQQSYVFDLEEDDEESEVSSSTIPASDGSTLAVKGTVASSSDKNEEIAKCEEVDDGDNLSMSEFESESSLHSSQIVEATSQKPKKLKDKDRKSLLKVIAEYFLKRKKDKAEAREENEDNSKDENKIETKKEQDKKKHGKNSSGKNKNAKKRKYGDHIRTKRENKKSSIKNGEKDAKEYLDFLNASHIDEASNSSVASAKDNVNIQEDSSGSSDNEVTQIENFKTASQKTHTDLENVHQNFDRIKEREKDHTNSNKDIEASKSDSADSEEIFGFLTKRTEESLSREAPVVDETVQSFSDFVNQLPIKCSDDVSNNKNAEDSDDCFDEDADITQKVDDIRRLRQVTTENEKDDVFDQPTQKFSGKDSNEHSNKEQNNLNKEEKVLKIEESSENQVVSPFKRKVVRPLPSTLSDSEETDEDILVVSPFKKKGVKRLHSSEESDSEPPKKTIVANNSQESNEFECATQEVVKPFKESSVKRLLSAENDESEATRKVLDSDESDLERKPKRRKVPRLISSASSEENKVKQDSEYSSPQTNKELEEDQYDIEEDQESSNENDHNIAPSQFKLDDKARDDFLEMFDQHTFDTNSQGKDSINEASSAVERDNNSGIEVAVTVIASQFKLGDCDRDNLLNLLTDKQNDERSGREEERERNMFKNKGTKKPLSVLNKPSNAPSQFMLNNEARDKFLDLLSSEQSITAINNDVREDKNVGKVAESDSSRKATNKVDDLKQNDGGVNTMIEPNQFKLNNAARDELLKMLSSEPTDNFEKKDNADLNGKGTHSTKSLNKNDDSKDGQSDEEIEPSQFKLNDKARDDFLDMLSSDQSDNSRDKNLDLDEVPSPDNDGTNQPEDHLKDRSDNDVDDVDQVSNPDNEGTDQPEDTSYGDDTDCKEKDDSEQPKDTLNNKDTNLKENDGENEAMEVDIDDQDHDDTFTENSQGINDIGDSDEDNDTLVAPSGTEEDEEKTDGAKDDQKAAAKSSEYNLDEKEKDELLNLLSDHIKTKAIGSDSDSSDSDMASEEENERSKEKRKLKKVDRDMLLELLEEYESAVAGKDEALVESMKNDGDMEINNMDSGNDNLQEIAESDFCEDSGSESVLLDLLREETVEQPEEGRRKKSRNTNKEAWNAYQQLLKESDDLSDTSVEISDIDIDDFKLDLSDQERKRKERILHDKLRKQFHIDKELTIDVKQSDISGFDLKSVTPGDGKRSSVIDRLCDLSNVLQKRTKPEKKRRKVKLRRLSRSVRSSVSASSISDSDSDSRTSSSSHRSDDSLLDSAGNRESPFPHLSDDNVEQEKLANALWEDIKNSSDENSGLSSDTDNRSSDSDEDKRKKRKGVGGKGKKGKKKKKASDSEMEDGTGDDTGSEKSGDGGDESDDGEMKEKNVKEADLDSSDEEDFVGVWKSKGAWKHDPLLKSCLTSDEESDSDGDSSQKRARSSARIKKKLKRKQVIGDGTEANSDTEKDGAKTSNKETENSSDSDVEFVMEKQKTPQKVEPIDEAEDDSPSKRGKGRRNIRALFEDDELAEATRQAKKEESERIKRLQEREKAKETFTQTQSLGSQLSEDESDPLILDVNEELQIKVHPKITKKLKPHQRSGIQFMWDSCYESLKQIKKGYEGSGCILAHCMGLGKTLQALALIHTLFNYKVMKTKHVLVVCPLSTVSNWKNEYKLAYKEIRHCNVPLYTIEGTKVASRRFEIVKSWRKNGGMLVMGYECFGIMINDRKLEKWAQNNLFSDKEDVLKALVNPGPDLVICDEGHLLRNKQTQRNLALNKVETKRRIILTGTPMQNNLLEYYYMVHFVKPNLLGTEKEYKTNFINPINNGQFENSTAIDILFMKKRTHVLHKILNKTVQRVEDTELKQYLPELMDQALFVKLSDLQVRFYNTYLDCANARPVEYTSSGNVSRKNFLGDIQVLRYICTHPDTVTIAKKCGKSKIKEQDVIDDNVDEAIEDKVFSKGDWYKGLLPESGVKKLELGTKMTVTLEIVKEAIACNDKVLIFSQTHAEMDSLEFFLKQELQFKKGEDYNRMDGTISPEVRTHMCDMFNRKHNKKLRVFIMSTKVGGLGLNLTAANRVILMNVNWNPSYDTQSVFRAFRFGQNKAVYVYRLIAIDTMEEKMYQREVTKLAVAHRVVDKHQITRHYSAADIQEFYSARPTIEWERPLPNVPEDRVLAKLIQKFPFLYKWHEHQALLANRPEEDLNEQQKNAAWEEFNKKAVDPPPPGLLPPPPQFVTASTILNQPGPSGIQNRIIAPGYPPVYPPAKRRRGAKRSVRLNQVPDRLQAMSGYVVPKTLPMLLKQTPDGPKLVFQTHGRIRERATPLRLGFDHADLNTVHPLSITDRPSVTVSVVDVNTGVESAPVDAGRDDDASRKIQEINSLVSAQTTRELISRFNTTTVTDAFNQSVVNDQGRASRIDEINSIISASLSQHDAVSSQDWDNDGMNATLMNLNLPAIRDTEDSTSGHFADHNYSLPKTNLLRTSSIDDFQPMPSRKPPPIPCPLFVDIDAPLDLDPPKRLFNHKIKCVKYKRPIVTQRTNSADDFRPTTQAKYVPRPVFVDVQAPLGPRPNLSGINPAPGQKLRSTTTTKPTQNQSPTASNSTTQQVRLGNGVTLTTQNINPRTNPPPAHAQKPSISIIPQPASTKPLSNITTTKPPPFVPKGSSLVQNPLNLTKNVQSVSVNRPARGTVWTQTEKTQNQLKKIVGHDLKNSKQMTTPLKMAQKIVAAKRVVAPHSPRVTAAPPLVPLPAKILAPPPLTRPALLPSSLVTSTATATNDPLSIPTTTTTSSPTTSTQQSPLQKRMRNFMEHLHKLQKSMEDKEADGLTNLGDSNMGRVWNPTGKNQGTSTIVNNKVGGVPMPSPLPARVVVRVGPKPLSPVVGGVSSTNAIAGLSAARNLSNITKTYQKAKDTRISDGMEVLINPSASQSIANRTNERVVGTLPSSIALLNTIPTTTRVILPNSNGHDVSHINGNGTKIIRKVITNSPKGAPRNSVGQPNIGSIPRIITYGRKPTSKNPSGLPNNESVPRVITNNQKGPNTVISSIGQPNNGNVARVITRVIDSKNVGKNTRVNPVGWINGNSTTAKMVPAGGNVTTRIVPVSPGHKKIVISQKCDIQRNAASVENQTSLVKFDLLPKNIIANLNRISAEKLLSKQPPLPPQRSFINGTHLKTYQAKKNNPPSRTSSLPSLSLSQAIASVSRSNKENRTKRKLSLRANNNNTSTDSSIAPIDLSNDENNPSSEGSLSKDMVNTLRKKGVSINYLRKDVINLD